MTLSGYFTPNSLFVPEVLHSEGSAFKNNCVKTNRHRPTLSVAKKCRLITVVSGNIKSFVDIRKRFLQKRLQTGVGSLKSTYLQFFRCYIFESFRNVVGINCTLRRQQRSRILPVPIRMTLNEHECRYNLKCSL